MHAVVGISMVNWTSPERRLHSVWYQTKLGLHGNFLPTAASTARFIFLRRCGWRQSCTTVRCLAEETQYTASYHSTCASVLSDRNQKGWWRILSYILLLSSVEICPGITLLVELHPVRLHCACAHLLAISSAAGFDVFQHAQHLQRMNGRRVIYAHVPNVGYPLLMCQKPRPQGLIRIGCVNIARLRL